MAFCNGTAALSAAYWAAQTSPYDRILTTPNTFVASLGTALAQGATTPVLVDLDRKTGNLNTDQLIETLPF